MNYEEVITSNFYRFFDKAKGVWERKSFWNKASDTEFEDGKTAEEKLGNIDGITDSTTVTSSKLAASATAVKSVAQKLNTNITKASIQSSSDNTQQRTYLSGNMNDNNPNIEIGHYTADSTTPEDVLSIYFDGTNFYARGVKDGADPVTKKLGEPIYLGVGTSFDVKNYYDKYSELTVDNFFIQPYGTISTSNWGYDTTGESGGHNIGQLGIKSLSASIAFSYNASTGVLTAYLAASSYGGVNNFSGSMKTASDTAAVKAYLIA